MNNISIKNLIEKNRVLQKDRSSRLYQYFVIELFIFPDSWQEVLKNKWICILIQSKKKLEPLAIYVFNLDNQESFKKLAGRRVNVFVNFLKKEKLLSKAGLLEVPILCFLGDNVPSRVEIFGNKPTLPILVSSMLISDFNKKNKSEYILIPDAHCLKQNFYNTRFFILDILRFLRPYNLRKKIAFWRGRSTGCEINKNGLIPREQLCNFSNEFPSFLDAKIVEYVRSVQAKAEYYDPKVVSIMNQTKFAIMIDIDGNTCTFDSLAWKLYSGSVVLRVESSGVQWYHYLLIPNKHYISVKRDFSNLLEKIKWCKEHDSECKKMTDEAASIISKKFNSKQIIKDTLESLRKYKKQFDDFRHE